MSDRPDITLMHPRLPGTNATATPASTTGSDQAHSLSHETAAAPAMQPAKKPTTSSKRLFQPLIGTFHQRLTARQRVQQRQHGVGYVAGHHGRRWRAGHGEAQKSELARHRGDAGHQSM